jgi:hypothetical protein
MNSELRGLFFAFISIIALLAGCTERLPIDPIYSDDTDWTPSISIAHNDYQRFELVVERPPRKELLRNILWYEIQLRTGVSTDYQRVDSISGLFNQPPYIYVGYYPLSHYPFEYLSEPILDNKTNYSVRMVSHYRTGISRISDAISFTTPTDRGSILKRIPFPKKVTSMSEWGNNRIAFHKGSLLMLRDTELWKVDTATGQSTLLIREFSPPPDNRNTQFRSIFVAGDSLFTYYEDYDFEVFTIVSVDLKSLMVDSTVRVSSPGRTLYQMESDGSQLLTLWYNLSTANLQFAIVDLHSGKIIQMFADGPSVVPYPYTYCSANGAWWELVWRDFDNRIVRFDPATLTILEDHPHPVFSPLELTWDGANFWSIDDDSRAIVKLLLR